MAMHTRVRVLALAAGLAVAIATNSAHAQSAPPRPPGQGWVKAYNYTAGGTLHTRWLRLRARRGQYVTVEETWSDQNGKYTSDSSYNTNAMYNCNGFKSKYLGTNRYRRGDESWQVPIPGTNGEKAFDVACSL